MSPLALVLMETVFIFMSASNAMMAYSKGKFYRAGFDVALMVLFSAFLSHDYNLLALH